MLVTKELGIAERRSQPHKIVVAPDLSILFYEPGAVELLELADDAPLDGAAQLPRALEDAVARRLHAEELDGPIDLESVVARIAPLNGARDGCVVILLEERRHRDHLARATRDYSLTNRERQVLALLLQGDTNAQIAAVLALAETTVTDHVKNLLKKTGSRNRAEMSARVLGYDAAR